MTKLLSIEFFLDPENKTVIGINMTIPRYSKTKLKEENKVIVRIYSVTGERVSSGVYFYTMQVGKFTATRKMVINE